MNQQSSKIPSDSELDELLRSVNVRVPLPDTFQVEVWRRIAVSQEAALPVRISRWLESFLSLMIRPALAISAVLMMTLAGAWFGWVGSGDKHDGKQVYLHSISPFAATHEGGKR